MPRLFLVLTLLALAIVPVTNAWCGTVCLAEAISSGCAHSLQPVDDLPLAPAPAPVLQPAVMADVAATSGDALHRQLSGKPPLRPPLRI